MKIEDFNAYPFASLLKKDVCFRHYITNYAKRHVLYYTLLLQMLSSFIQPVSTEGSDWDGVVVTASNFEALQAFKHDLDDPNGCLRSWNDSGYGACSGGWEGIKCAQGEVIVIQLPRRGLGGRISEKIGQLQGLRKLSLHDNQVGGFIPSSLGILSNLRGLQLYNNRLSGSIPPLLGSCPLLQSLELSNNSLTGSIPDSLANLSRLFRLNLSYNSLSGSIPASLTSSPSLLFLSLDHNNLSGPVPNSWGRAAKLQSLTLDHNSLSGSIPASLGKLSDLLEISLCDNHITGPIPVELGNLSRLKTLDLSNNNIGGPVPPQLDHLNFLYIFNVSYNNLSGPVPSLLLQKFNLSSFIGNIQLCGYNASALCASEEPMELKSHRRKPSVKDIFLIAIGFSLIVLLIICCILLSCLLSKRAALKRKKAERAARDEKGVPGIVAEAGPGGESGGKLVHFDGSLAFTADDLLCATAEILGKSTYGTVYKAIFEDGNQLAVKRLREKLAKNVKEFEAEVNVLGKIRHPNLLAMRAYYLGPKGEKLLAYDYMPKGSLSTFLHARGPESPIDWPTRKKIIQDIACGLLYLHTEANMIHTNLTSSNVLLDEHTNSKIGDFGLYRLMTSAANTNVLAAAGALGYKAPELSNVKKANTKTDVYSLGVIMLELLTGKSPSEALNGADLPQWVASIVKEEWTYEVFDLELMGDASTVGDELLNTLKLALHCVDPSPAARPEVQQVLQQLEEIKPQVPTSSGD